MTLGQAFPPGLAAMSIRRQLRPGAVIKLRRVMDDGRIHEKRFVVIHVDERTVTCVINSAISVFVQTRPALLRCQVAMPAAAHSFMENDSHVDCSRTHAYATNDVVRVVGAGDKRIIVWFAVHSEDFREAISEGNPYG